jgi:hypothetical protein
MRHYFFTIFLSAIFISNMTWAAGITTHMFMADIAIERVKEPAFKDFMLKHRKAIRNGAIFPDSGYLKKATYGEFAHWEQFQNGYAMYMDENCAWPLSDHCEDLFAFFLGALAHSIGDVAFHRDFISEVAKQDCNGDYSLAHKVSDPGVDMLSIFDYNRGIKISAPYFPTTELEKIFSQSGFEVPKSELRFYSDAGYAVMLAERAGSPFAYLYYKYKMPWAAANYYAAKGGVLDSSLAIAEIWDQVWLRLVRDERFVNIAKFKSSGGFPNVTIVLE